MDSLDRGLSLLIRKKEENAFRNMASRPRSYSTTFGRQKGKSKIMVVNTWLGLNVYLML